MTAKAVIVLVLAVLGIVLCAVAATAVGNDRLGHAGGAVIGVAVLILATGT